MSEIVIPFREDMKEQVILGNKGCTSRSKKYGEPGDTFRFDYKFNDGTEARYEAELLAVVKLPLYFVCETLYKPEGFDSPDDFIKVWEEIHPQKGYYGMSHEMVFVHFFYFRGEVKA